MTEKFEARTAIKGSSKARIDSSYVPSESQGEGGQSAISTRKFSRFVKVARTLHARGHCGAESEGRYLLLASGAVARGMCIRKGQEKAVLICKLRMPWKS